MVAVMVEVFVEFGFEYQATGINVFYQTEFILRLQIFGPIEPVVIPFAGRGHPIRRGVMQTNNGTGAGCRAIACRRQFVYVQCFVLFFG